MAANHDCGVAPVQVLVVKHQATCRCGWESEPHASETHALDEARRHQNVEALAKGARS